MNGKVEELMQQFAQLQEELERELNQRRKAFHVRLEQGKVRFEARVLQYHRTLRQTLPRFLGEAELRNVLSAPFIYGLIGPLLLFDLAITLYQQVCFRLYRIPLVPRDDFVVVDRGSLGYLNLIEKVNCLYCSYANGLFAYAREIGARTEQYWCPIKHARRTRDPHSRYLEFIDYGDVEGYRQRAPEQRERARRGPL
ncbi:hypothetical protein [Endothiovibrio diazotrophicus]